MIYMIYVMDMIDWLCHCVNLDLVDQGVGASVPSILFITKSKSGQGKYLSVL